MTLGNDAIADRLEALAAVLELADADGYTVRAHRRAAETIRHCPAPVGELVAAGRGRELRGVGARIDAKLRELVATGAIAELAELERDLAPDLVGLIRYLGLSARRAIDIARALQIRTADQLRAAAGAGRLREVPGIGPAIEAQIVAALARETEARAPRGLHLNRAEELVGAIARALDAQPAGDARRGSDACHRLAVVCAARPADAAAVLDRFAELPQIVAVVERGEHRAVGVTVEGVPVELVVAAPAAFGTAVLRATGSAEYVAALEPLPDGADEPAVYATLEVPWCPPELREAPHRRAPPAGLLELDDIRGDLHAHTTRSDGRAGVAEMADAARARGYDYLAICDHTPAVGAVPGLDADAVRRQAEEIAQVNAAVAPLRVLAGIECDILPDGRLDLPDDVLAELDWVQVSVHGGQRMPGPEMTRRVAEALHHPAVRCLSHPTGRLIGRRPENALDLDAIYELARDRNVALEVNGLPARLDLSGPHVRDALRAGVSIVCSTDAHSTAGLANMRFSVATARRGWATAADVLNSRPLDALLHRPP